MVKATGTETITVVTGIARSGTSLMMRMLRAGGIPLLYDDVHAPDALNPAGFYEYAPTLSPDDAWLDQAEGNAVKLFYPGFLPLDRPYKFIVMRRDLREVEWSLGGGVSAERLQQELGWLLDWLLVYQPGRYLEISYRSLIEDPGPSLAALAGFLELSDTAAMAAVIDPAWYRNRVTAP